MSVFRISKLDAARQQLETAINLYFCEGDVVSIHTLTAAALNVVRDITKRSEPDMRTMRDTMVSCLRPEKRKFVAYKIREPENFFKHADRDPDTFLTFNSGLSEFDMYDCIATYQKLTVEFNPLFEVFKQWHELQHPDVFVVAQDQKLVSDEDREALRSMTKQAFFEWLLPYLNKLERPLSSKLQSYP
jgi:hypothetical protein